MSLRYRLTKPEIRPCGAPAVDVSFPCALADVKSGTLLVEGLRGSSYPPLRGSKEADLASPVPQRGAKGQYTLVFSSPLLSEM